MLKPGVQTGLRKAAADLGPEPPDQVQLRIRGHPKPVAIAALAAFSDEAELTEPI